MTKKEQALKRLEALHLFHRSKTFEYVVGIAPAILSDVTGQGFKLVYKELLEGCKTKEDYLQKVNKYIENIKD